jgi:CO dehydrogenase nickel-insertion accessory protein CooC1
VKAAVAITGKGGTGDTTTQLLLRRGIAGRR